VHCRGQPTVFLLVAPHGVGAVTDDSSVAIDWIIKCIANEPAVFVKRGKLPHVGLWLINGATSINPDLPVIYRFSIQPTTGELLQRIWRDSLNIHLTDDYSLSLSFVSGPFDEVQLLPVPLGVIALNG